MVLPLPASAAALASAAAYAAGRLAPRRAMVLSKLRAGLARTVRSDRAAGPPIPGLRPDEGGDGAPACGCAGAAPATQCPGARGHGRQSPTDQDWRSGGADRPTGHSYRVRRKDRGVEQMQCSSPPASRLDVSPGGLLMAYMMVESSIRAHRKFLRAGPAASWLWLCGLGHCQDGLTDGFIAAEAIEFLGVKKPVPLAKTLVEVGLWEEVPGGWRMHDYFDHNKPAEQVREIMRKRREGGKLGGRPPKNLQGSNHENHGGYSCENLGGFENRETCLNLPENPFLPVLPELPTDRPEEIAPAASSPVESPVVLVFPIVGPGMKSWALTEAHLADLQGDYPRIDVLAECRKAAAWAKANPSRQKTAKGMPAFLVNWINIGVNHGTATPRYEAGLRTVLVDDDWFDECKRLHHGGCGGRLKHSTQMRLDADKKRTA